ncbi:MAG: ferritin family protein [Candidatus Brocadiaceae bacterium]|nr:ferritin family protein [Candidatus Brocadiaceae bacterium]
MRDELKRALELAQKLELDGAEYYGKLSEECSSAAARRMFESFASDERRHLRIVREVAEGVGVDLSKMPMPRDEIATIFTRAAAREEADVEATETEREAVRVALSMETKSFQMYRDAAGRAEDAATRELLERLAREENQHYEMLENTLEYLSENPKWFLWNEWALVVGDQSSLGIE